MFHINDLCYCKINYFFLIELTDKAFIPRSIQCSHVSMKKRKNENENTRDYCLNMRSMVRLSSRSLMD